MAEINSSARLPILQLNWLPTSRAPDSTSLVADSVATQGCCSVAPRTPRGARAFFASAPRPPTGRRRAPSRVTRRLPWNQGRACFCLHEASWQQGCGSRVLLFRLQKHVVSFAGEALFGHSVPLLHQNPHVWPPRVACYAAWQQAFEDSTESMNAA